MRVVANIDIDPPPQQPHGFSPLTAEPVAWRALASWTPFLQIVDWYMIFVFLDPVAFLWQWRWVPGGPTLSMAVVLLLGLINNPQHKVDNNGQEEYDGQESRAEAVIETSLASHSNGFGPPMVCGEGIYHGEHGDSGEEKGGDEGDAVTKVEHANGEGTEDDGEVQP